MDMKVGDYLVATTSNGGHSAEFYAETLVNKIIFVSQNAPEPIKAQALIYKDSLYKVVLDTIQRALASERSLKALPKG